MKTIKLIGNEIKINREIISKFGETIYHCPEVNFKDGSSIGFEREEFEDEVERKIGGGE